MAVNLSARQLLLEEMPAVVRGILDETGLPAELLEIELTESIVMENSDEAVAALTRLKALGLRLAIDDFGTGFSSLSYLRRLPFDTLKIDKSFVMAMERDADDAKIVRSTIDLAHNLGLSVVAEGVENAAILGLLQLDCLPGKGKRKSNSKQQEHPGLECSEALFFVKIFHRKVF